MVEQSNCIFCNKIGLVGKDLWRFDSNLACEECIKEKWKVRQWPKIRKKVFERDNYICQKCKKNNKYKLEAHHIKSKVLGGTEELDNLITLCWKCYKLEHKKRISKQL